MNINDNYSDFKAILKSEEGEILAEGTGGVDVSAQSVTFKSNFVPLYPIGTPMEMVRIFNEREIHRFWGKVYLSDKRLMRIVAVEDELLLGSEECYCDNMDFAASVVPCFPLGAQNKGFFKKSRGNEPSTQHRFDVKVIQITAHQLTFVFDASTFPFYMGPTKDGSEWGGNNPLSEVEEELGLRFVIDGKAPLPLEGVWIQVVDLFYFGESISYRCDFINQMPGDYIRIHEFLWAYNLENHKLF